MGSAHRVRVRGSVRVIIVTHGGWGWWGCLPPLFSLSATCDRKCVDHRQAAQLALGNQICATWTLEGVGYSKHQLQASHVFQRTVGARWNSAAHRGPAIDIQLTGGAAALGPGASCCPPPQPSPKVSSTGYSGFSSPTQTV